MSLATTTLASPAVAAINHLLVQEAWARAALTRHAGKVACIDASGIALRMRVAKDGMLETATADAGVTPPANVTIRLKLADVPLILQNRERAFSYVKIEGDAEFANTISQLSNGLRWDAEYDLEKVVGPIAANRLAGGARSVTGLLTTLQRKALENMAEFLTEEQPVLVRPVQAEGFGSEVTRLRDDVERAAKRIARLEQALQQKLAPQRSAAANAPAMPGGQQFLDH
jgi:ubiquinone biosynthesis protein UbiJ